MTLLFTHPSTQLLLTQSVAYIPPLNTSCHCPFLSILMAPDPFMSTASTAHHNCESPCLKPKPSTGCPQPRFPTIFLRATLPLPTLQPNWTIPLTWTKMKDHQVCNSGASNSPCFCSHYSLLLMYSPHPPCPENFYSALKVHLKSAFFVSLSCYPAISHSFLFSTPTALCFSLLVLIISGFF